MRGEDLQSAHWRLLVKGSPPHARGRRSLPGRRTSSTRITPACAGKTQLVGSSQKSQEDHPRMRGEDTKWTTRSRSPRWITPACAGKTPKESFSDRRDQDHPRMRGEDGNLVARMEVRRGSPPHARGRPYERVQTCFAERITPACAGKTQREPA